MSLSKNNIIKELKHKLESVQRRLIRFPCHATLLEEEQKLILLINDCEEKCRMDLVRRDFICANVCSTKNCKIIAEYGYRNTNNFIAIKCYFHKTNNMFKKYNKSCNVPDCNNIATHNFPCNPPIVCDLHKKTKMTYLAGSICFNYGCMNHGIFRLKKYNGEFIKIGNPFYCETHKARNMSVDIRYILQHTYRYIENNDDQNKNNDDQNKNNYPLENLILASEILLRN